MAIDALQQYLPELSPALLLKLSEAEREQLLELLTRARRMRAEEQETTIEAALAQAPALLRSTLRRMLTE